ncbi:MAG TPA: adenylyltransferase/cytidyltransferase family protein [Candidatus Acidoferrales bacterium]|nr:adenylyltransferase/cytidyltransferase family protein [Candidatus Acidoferrales bacterium]
MGQIINIEKVDLITSKLQAQNKQIVLAGGCFDLLHIGHITFLEKAKKLGDLLVILLESDETITASKGANRPINSQADRAKILSALLSVDIVILLSPKMTDKEYDALVFAIKPAIIATTSGDMQRHHKERQAKQIGAHVVDVTMPISDKSTTKLVNLLNEL